MNYHRRTPWIDDMRLFFNDAPNQSRLPSHPPPFPLPSPSPTPPPIARPPRHLPGVFTGANISPVQLYPGAPPHGAATYRKAWKSLRCGGRAGRCVRGRVWGGRPADGQLSPSDASVSRPAAVTVTPAEDVIRCPVQCPVCDVFPGHGPPTVVR